LRSIVSAANQARAPVVPALWKWLATY